MIIEATFGEPHPLGWTEPIFAGKAMTLIVGFHDDLTSYQDTSAILGDSFAGVRGLMGRVSDQGITVIGNP